MKVVSLPPLRLPAVIPKGQLQPVVYIANRWDFVPSIIVLECTREILSSISHFRSFSQLLLSGYRERFFSSLIPRCLYVLTILVYASICLSAFPLFFAFCSSFFSCYKLFLLLHHSKILFSHFLRELLAEWIKIRISD